MQVFIMSLSGQDEYLLDDSTISVGTTAVLIDDIKKISVRTTFSKVSGPIISGGGVAGTIFLTPLFIKSLAFFGEGVLQVFAGIMVVPIAAAGLAGCAVAAIGGIVYFINGNVYKARHGWDNYSTGWQIQVADNDYKQPPGH